MFNSLACLVLDSITSACPWDIHSLTQIQSQADDSYEIMPELRVILIVDWDHYDLLRVRTSRSFRRATEAISNSRRSISRPSRRNASAALASVEDLARADRLSILSREAWSQKHWRLSDLDPPPIQPQVAYQTWMLCRRFSSRAVVLVANWSALSLDSRPTELICCICCRRDTREIAIDET